MFLVKAFKNVLSNAVFNDCRLMQVAGKRTHPKSKKRVPPWHYRVKRSKTLDLLTNENKKFVTERVTAEYGPKIMYKGSETYESQSLLKVGSIEPQQWKRGMHRVGTIAKKLGHYPLWLKDGTKITTTVLQIVDNHVVRYIPPEEFNPTKRKLKTDYSKWGCIMVGSGAADPTTVTANYAGLFKGTGVMPSKLLFRFIVNPKAALPSGTPLNVSHYRVGDFVDVRGKTVNRGYQGVMKKWGFKGQPATHGQTKTHRRPGSLSSGRRKGLWRGKKMPGWMGNKWRVSRGLKIWRINTATNTMWVSGGAIPGNPNEFVYIFDTLLPSKHPKEPYPMPTFLGDDSQLPEDIYDEKVHKFTDSTIFYEPEK